MPVVLEEDLAGSAPSANCVVGGVAGIEAAAAVSWRTLQFLLMMY